MNHFVAELIGTMILILLGDGVCANVILKKTKGHGSGWIVITAGWALAVAMGVYAVGRYSGAHLNPAITLAFACIGSLKWDEVPAYLGGQMIGAILGAILVYLVHFDHWKETEEPADKLAVFCTAPAVRHFPINFLCEFVGTWVLVFVVLCIGANSAGIKGGPVDLAAAFGTGLNPLLVGFLIWAIGLSLGGPTGYAINPARDLGPRIAHAILPIPGKGSSDWGYAWVPILGPILGGILGAVMFQTLAR
jgi:glycerol uptake facilitator protein